MALYVFVGGLHRSGTSIVSRMIASLENVASISDAPAPENEGVYLQGAIPHTALHGRPMHFATDPDQHHIEGGSFDRLDVRDRIASDWENWFQPQDAPWRLEKSPVNFSRMRLYQQLFPLSQFIVVIRHPQAVAGAVAKWVDLAPDEALDHWIEAHGRMQGDAAHLHSVMILRYEDIMERPRAHMEAFAAFLQLPPRYDFALPSGHRNDAYPGWSVTPGREASLADWGYGPGMGQQAYVPIVRHPLRAVREGVSAALRRQTRES